MGPSSRGTSQPTLHRVVLRLLDHQVVGPHKELLGNVDDLGLTIGRDGWVVTGLRIGPAGLGRRLPGKLGTWTVAIWRRLSVEPDPRATFVPMAEVTDIGSAIAVSPRMAESLAASFGLELWLREFVVSRIPGAKGGGDDQAAGAQGRGKGKRKDNGSSRRSTAWPTAEDPATSAVSDILGARVVAADGARLGVVNDLVCAEPSGRGPRDHLRVTHLVYGPHTVGSRLGYDADGRQGPLVVGALVRWWQRGHRVAALEDVASVDLDTSTVKVTSRAGHVHPRDL